jgi:hypothetical protein
MPAVDSSTTGYLLPSAAPPNDDAADDILHDMIVGITGIPNQMVRPKWQAEPPEEPDFTTNWAAFGISHIERDLNAYREQLPDGQGAHVERDEILNVLVCFYGPQAAAYATQLHDGLEIDQNRDALTTAHMGLCDVGEPRVLPALLKQKWVRRVDLTLRIRRRSSRDYAIRTVASADVDLNNERYTEHIHVQS